MIKTTSVWITLSVGTVFSCTGLIRSDLQLIRRLRMKIASISFTLSGLPGVIEAKRHFRCNSLKHNV